MGLSAITSVNKIKQLKRGEIPSFFIDMDVKRFVEAGKYYVYDVNINQIIEVEKIIYEILPYLEQNRPLTFLKEYTSSQIQLALQEIKKFQKEYGLFRPPKIKGVYLSEKEVYEKLNSHLYHLILDITEACNLRCGYCSYGCHYPHERDHSNKHMDWNIAKRAIDFLFEHAEASEEVIVGFYGGEPLLVPELIKMCVRYAKKRAKERKKQVSFALTTNGSLLSKGIISFLANENFNLLVSLDGPKEIHDRYRVTLQGKGSFDRIIGNLKKIKMDYPEYFKKHVGYSCVLSPPFDLLKVKEFFSKFDFQTKGPLLISLANIEDNTFYEGFPPEIWKDYNLQFDKLRGDLINQIEAGRTPDRFLLSLFGKRLQRWHNRLIGEIKLIPPNGICILGHQRTFIGTDGKIYPCEKLSYKLPIGNVYQGFNFDTIIQLIKNYVDLCSKCLRCWLRRACSICFAKAVKPLTGLLHNLDKERKEMICKIEEKNAFEDLKLYVRVIDKMPVLLEGVKIKIFEE